MAHLSVNNTIYQSMKHEEAEHLKDFLYENKGGWKELDALVTCIAHWMQQRGEIGFDQFVSHWAYSNRKKGTKAIQKHWPMTEHYTECNMLDNSKWYRGEDMVYPEPLPEDRAYQILYGLAEKFCTSNKRPSFAYLNPVVKGGIFAVDTSDVKYGNDEEDIEDIFTDLWEEEDEKMESVIARAESIVDKFNLKWIPYRNKHLATIKFEEEGVMLDKGTDVLRGWQNYLKDKMQQDKAVTLSPMSQMSERIGQVIKEINGIKKGMKTLYK